MSNHVSFLAYVQLLDSSLPIGGFSHSFGLETYVQQQKVNTLVELEHYMIGQIHAALIRLEGLAIKGVYHAMDRQDLAGIILLDQMVHVQRAPRESREGLHKMGKRLMKLGKSLYPEVALHELESTLATYSGYGTFPIVFAWITYKLDIDLDTAVEGYLYTSVTTMVNSALRLMSIGQTDGQLLIRRMQRIYQEQWSLTRELPADQLHSFTPAHDIRAMQHETLYSRLFMS
jgi:urease accessory protein